MVKCRPTVYITVLTFNEKISYLRHHKSTVMELTDISLVAATTLLLQVHFTFSVFPFECTAKLTSDTRNIYGRCPLGSYCNVNGTLHHSQA